MGTVVIRRRRNGTIAHRAQISITRGARIVLRETKTFDRPQAANAWIKKREKELEKPETLDQAIEARRLGSNAPTLAMAIDRLIMESKKDLGGTKVRVLRSIKDFDIADLACDEITSIKIVDFARQKIRSGATPQMVSSCLSHLRAVFITARPAWGYPLDPQAMEDAWTVANKLGIAKNSDRRDRRPTLAELDRLMEHFGDRALQKPVSVPMQHIIAFAIFSTRRREEITRIEWDDLQEAKSRIMIRDVKNPDGKKGNDVWCDLPPEALQIIKAMPQIDDRIFPYDIDTINASFTRACALLDIKDLQFDDLRHDGISRLFELHYTVPRAAAVSGHRSWTSLKRYTHLEHVGDKYGGWRWLPVLTAPLVIFPKSGRRSARLGI